MADLPSDPQNPDDPAYLVGMWRSELTRAKKEEDERWSKQAKDAIDRYALKDKSGTTRSARFNVLYSNVKTMAPAIYSKPPKVVAQRRFLDKDPIGRIACRIVERATQYQVDTGELHDVVKLCVMDRLLPGRGQAWCRYEATLEDFEVTSAVGTSDGYRESDDRYGQEGDSLQGSGASGDAGIPVPQRIATECVHVDHVNWKDFRHEPARTWDEVGWVARRAFMSRKALRERFGEVADKVELNVSPDGKAQDGKSEYSELRKAEVWEIWVKETAEVIWIAEGFDQPLDRKPDWLKLEGFFPCPKPLYSTVTTDSLMPVTDYEQYRPQAEQMDSMTMRIKQLVAACQVKGVYDERFTILGEMLKNDESTLHPVEEWAQWQAASGFKGAVDFMPIEMFAKVIGELIAAKAEVKADIYEISGISDILRGQGESDETATGVQTKGRFATLRLADEQAEVARFVRDIVRIIAEITCELFQPDTLAEMSSAQEMDDLQIPAPPMGMMPGPGMPQPAMGQGVPLGIGQ